MAGIGIACAPIFTGLMIFVGEGADENEGLRTLTIVSAIGVAGSLLAGTPLGLAAQVFGWRASIAWSSPLLATPAVVIWFAMDDKLQPRPSDAPPTTVAPLEVAQLLLPILPACLAMAAGSALRSSWAGPYLGVAFGANSQGIGDAMTVVSIVAIAFGFAVPVLLLRLSPRALSKMTWVIGAAAAIMLALLPFSAVIVSIGGLAVLVALGGVYPLVIDQARRLFPPDKSGLALSAASMCAFLSVSLLSLLFGAVGGIAKAAKRATR